MTLISRLARHLTINLELTPSAKARMADERRRSRHTHAAHTALDVLKAQKTAELRAAVKS